MADQKLLLLAVFVTAPGMMTLVPQLIIAGLRTLARRARRRRLSRAYTSFR